MAVASTRSTPSDDVSLELAKDVVTASETADSEKLGHEEAGESVREYPRGSQLWLVSIALYVGGFLICLVSFIRTPCFSKRPFLAPTAASGESLFAR